MNKLKRKENKTKEDIEKINQLQKEIEELKKIKNKDPQPSTSGTQKK